MQNILKVRKLYFLSTQWKWQDAGTKMENVRFLFTKGLSDFSPQHELLLYAVCEYFNILNPYI